MKHLIAAAACHKNSAGIDVNCPNPFKSGSDVALLIVMIIVVLVIAAAFSFFRRRRPVPVKLKK